MFSCLEKSDRCTSLMRTHLNGDAFEGKFVFLWDAMKISGLSGLQDFLSLFKGAAIRRQFFKQNFNKQMLVNMSTEKTLCMGLRHKTQRADTNESDDNEKYLI